MFRRSSISAVVVGLAAATLVAGTPGGSSAAPAGKARPTDFAMLAGGYASRTVDSEDVPVGSDKTAFAGIGCTNKAGLDSANKAANSSPSEGVGVKNARTHAWTSKRGDNVSSWSQHTIQRVNILDAPIGSVSLRGLVSTSHTWNDGKKFHANTSSKVGSIVFDPVDGDPQELPLPEPGEPVTVPGLVTIRSGQARENESAGGADASIDALQITQLASGNRVYLAHSSASIDRGVKSALFSGQAWGSQSSTLDGVSESGRDPVIVMPCQGTGDRVLSNSTASADLAPDATAAKLTVNEMAGVENGKATIVEQARVSRVNLGGGLLVRGIVGKVKVVRDGKKVTKSTQGTEAGIVTYNGEEQQFPDTGVLEIPGVARFKRAIVDRSKNGISVTALRITLLDGRLSVIDLGHAQAAVKPSGR